MYDSQGRRPPGMPGYSPQQPGSDNQYGQFPNNQRFNPMQQQQMQQQGRPGMPGQGYQQQVHNTCSLIVSI